MEQGLTKNEMISALTKSPHGDLGQYEPMVRRAAAEEPEFLAHLIAWNEANGEVRDAKVALPLLSLTAERMPDDFVENSLAHLMTLDPRNLLKAFRYTRQAKTTKRMKLFKRTTERYLRTREMQIGWFDATAIRHRRTLQELYALMHLKPLTDRANIVLYGRTLAGEAAPPPKGSVFEALSQLALMPPAEAAGTITKRGIPPMIAAGALGAKAKDPDVVLALIGGMTPTELVTNMKLFESLGVNKHPALRGALNEALSKAGEKKAKGSKNTLKTTRAAEAVTDDTTKAKLRGLQERQLANLKGIEGNWLVLGDKSNSMVQAIEISRYVASTLAKLVRGNVYLYFFDITPRYIDATGKDYDALLAETKHVSASGGTSIGCALLAAREKKFDIDGIAIISDAQENTTPIFVQQYAELSRETGKQVPVYLYRLTPGMRGPSDVDLGAAMRKVGFDMQEFDLTKGNVDYYALPNLVQTMRSNRYGLVEEIMETPLLTLDAVFKKGGN